MALSSSLVSLGVLVGIFGLLGLGLNIKFGYTGLLDIGHVAFFLVGAYLTALLVAPPSSEQQFAQYVLGLNWPWLPALAAGTVAAGVLGLLVALPAIRLREDYLAIAVLGISVILRRIVQSEGWLANGPDSLRGYPLPLREHFPLPAGDPAGAVVTGVVVAVFWAGATYLLTTGLGDRETGRNDVLHAFFAVTTLGVGYAASRWARGTDYEPPGWLRQAAGGVGALALAAATVLWVAGVGGGSVQVATLVGLLGVAVAALADTAEGLAAAASGVVVGGLAAAALVGTATVLPAALGNVVVLVVFGALSLFAWGYGGLLVVRTFSDLTTTDVVVGLGLAVAFAGTFAPVVFVDGLVGLVATTLLLAAYLAVVYQVATDWESRGTPAAFPRIVGAAALWLFAIRYFLLPLLGPLGGGDVPGALSELLQNLLWLTQFGTQGVVFDYQRFLLAVVFAAVGLCYYVLELTVESPFGRVLTAIREDEDVATALGKNVFSYKVQSMVLGSAVAGLAGGLYAIKIPALTHTLFAPRVTFVAFLIVVIGGTASNRGAVLGAVIYWGFWRGTTDLASTFPTGVRASMQALRLAVFGALFILVLYYRPEGVLGEKGTQIGGG